MSCHVVVVVVVVDGAVGSCQVASTGTWPRLKFLSLGLEQRSDTLRFFITSHATAIISFVHEVTGGV